MAQLAFLIAGAAVTAGSQLQQGRVARSQAETQQLIDERNARIAETAAEEERLAAEDRATAQARAGEELIGRQRAIIGAAGVGFTGSSLAVLQDTQTTLELDRLAILRRGVVSAQARRTQAQNLRLEGRSTLARGISVERGSRIRAGTSILTGAGRVLSN